MSHAHVYGDPRCTCDTCKGSNPAYARKEGSGWRLQQTARSPARLMTQAGECIALVYLTDGTTKRRTDEAMRRARLIEAAPELAEALRECAAALRVAQDALDRNIGDEPDSCDADCYADIETAREMAAAALAKVQP